MASSTYSGREFIVGQGQYGTALTATWELTGQSQANNSSTILLREYYYVGSTTYGSGGATFSLDGKTTSWGDYSLSSGYTLIQSKTITVNHNADGSFPGRNVNISASGYTSLAGVNQTGTITGIPKINRYAVTNKVTGDDIEGNFSVDYSTYMSGYKYKLRISIPNVTRLDRIDYNTSGETFTLSQEVIDDLFTRFSNTNTFNLGFAVETWSNDGTDFLYEGNEKIITARITNANPTMTYTCTETNSKAITVLGGNNTNYLIENVSTPSVVVTPTTLKGATVSRVDLTNGTYTSSKTTSPYSFSFTAIDGTIGLKVVDSRNNSVEETITKTLIEYEPVTINSFNFERTNPTSSNLVLNADIKYYQKTFNQTANVPTIQWQCVEEGQDLDPNGWITISSSDYTVDTTNNKITITNLLLSNVLDYRTKGTLYLKINDLLTEFSNNMQVIKGIPTMDMGEHDICINGDLYIADENRNNKINIKDMFIDTYSETESLTNKIWIDNEPIYRKVVETGSINSTTKSVAHNISNLGTIIELKGFVMTSGGTTFTLPRIVTTALNQQIGLNVDSTNITIEAGSNANFNDSFVIIEYTKSS